MEFIRFGTGNFYLKATVLKFGDLLGGWKLLKNEKFQHNILKMTPGRQKKTTWTWEYHYSNM